MPRDLPIGNEHFLVMFDRSYQIAEVFYPHVGMENHVLGHPFRFGVFADNVFSWTASWSKQLEYVEDTIVTKVTLESPEMKLKLEINDCVDFVSPIYLRRIKISSSLDKQREIKLFFAHDFHLKGTDVGDTAYYDPARTQGLIHYKADRYFLMNCLTDKGEGIHEYACGVKEVGGSLGTWKDAEDGFLSGNPIAQGSVDSVMSTLMDVNTSSQSTLYYWMVAGKTYDEVQRRDAFVKSRTPEKLLKRTLDFWKLWVLRDIQEKADLDDDIWKLYRRSLLTIKTQTDGDGAVIAANDTDILQFNKDTYSYMWPRDGAFVTMAMDEAGYPFFARLFFEFCSKAILPQGWFFHKYQPDGSAGSSWHPWIVGNQQQLPLQEDETALVVISLWNNFELWRDVDLIKPYYRPIIKAAGNFMVKYRDELTKLPLESYDLWEERREVLTFTTAAVHRGLVAAANFATSFGEHDLAIEYTRASDEVKDALLEHLYSPTLQRFLRGVSLNEGKIVKQDDTIDSSLAGVFLFKVLPEDDPMVVNTMKQVEEKLSVRTEVGGVARYDHDVYQRLGDSDSNMPGNPWFVTTIWLADWYIGIAKQRSELSKAKDLLRWCVAHALPSGTMAEQLNPINGSPLSVSPLTWSHAAFVDSVNKYSKKYDLLSS